MENEGSTFVIRRSGGNGIDAVLHTVDWQKGRPGSSERINLYFHVTDGRVLDPGIYLVEHPVLGSFEMRIERVQAGGLDPLEVGYRAVVSGETPGG